MKTLKKLSLVLSLAALAVIIFCKVSPVRNNKEDLIKQAETIVRVPIKDPRWFYYPGRRITGFDFQVEPDWFYSVVVKNHTVTSIRKTPMPGNHEAPMMLYGTQGS